MMSLVLAALLAISHSADEPFEPPKSDRPTTFSGAVGLFRVKSSAQPTTTPAGEPIRFVVTITAEESVPVHSPPTRPELEKNADFTRLFQFDTPQVAQRQDGKKWEFFYLLKPKQQGETEIPEVVLCIFNPMFGQSPKGFQYPSADAIPITVTPALVKTVPVDLAVLEITPSSLGIFAADDSVLQSNQTRHPLPLGWLIALLLAPPLGSFVWLLVWRRLYPDAARRATQRRSRAARTALASLAAARTEEASKRAEHISQAVTAYLRERFDLRSVVPTPVEVDQFLRGVSVPDALRERASALFQTCDALRFSPVPPAVSDSLTAEAEQVILELEARSWHSPHS